MSENPAGAGKRRRRSAPLLWGSGAVAAVTLILGVNGTLSAWTTAIIDNNNNSVASTTAVALVETQTAPTGNSTICDTAAATNGSNSVTCAGINKYGGIGDATASTDTGFATDASGTPLAPGGSQAVTVNLKNDGTGGGSLVLAAGSCANHAYPGSTGSDTTNYNLCNEMHLVVSCSSPSSFAYSGTVAAFTGGTIGTLGATVSTNCTFTVSLPSAAASGFSSQYLTQDLSWTLTAS
jgi:hypothetical protein